MVYIKPRFVSTLHHHPEVLRVNVLGRRDSPDEEETKEFFSTLISALLERVFFLLSSFCSLMSKEWAELTSTITREEK